MQVNSKKTPIRNVARVILPEGKIALLAYDKDDKFLIGIGNNQTKNKVAWVRSPITNKDIQRLETAYRATTRRLYSGGIMTREQKAIAIGNDTDKLKKRLLEARSVMDRAFQLFFKKYVYCFKRKCLISNCGRWALQWRIREHPDQPESYENQQTNRGTVVFVQLKELEL